MCFCVAINPQKANNAIDTVEKLLRINQIYIKIKEDQVVIKKNWEQIEEISLTVQTEMKRTANQL